MTHCSTPPPLVKRGRPKLKLDLDQIHLLQEEGLSLREIGRKIGAGKDTVRDALRKPVGKMSKKPQDATSPFVKAPPLGSANVHKAPSVTSGPILKAYITTFGGRPIRIFVGGVHQEDTGLFEALRTGVRWPARIEVDLKGPDHA